MDSAAAHAPPYLKLFYTVAMSMFIAAGLCYVILIGLGTYDEYEWTLRRYGLQGVFEEIKVHGGTLFQIPPADADLRDITLLVASLGGIAGTFIYLIRRSPS